MSRKKEQPEDYKNEDDCNYDDGYEDGYKKACKKADKDKGELYNIIITILVLTIIAIVFFLVPLWSNGWFKETTFEHVTK